MCFQQVQGSLSWAECLLGRPNRGAGCDLSFFVNISSSFCQSPLQTLSQAGVFASAETALARAATGSGMLQGPRWAHRLTGPKPPWIGVDC